MSSGIRFLGIKGFVVIIFIINCINLVKAGGEDQAIKVSIFFISVVNAVFTFIIFSSKDKLQEIELKDILDKSITIIILFLTLGGYIFIINMLYSLNKFVSILAVILMSILVVQTIILDLIDGNKLSKRQLKWFEVMNNSNKQYKKPNIFWRFKIWFNPRFDIKDLPKNTKKDDIGILTFIFIVALIFFIKGEMSMPFFIAIVIAMDFGLSFRYLLDKIFGTYVKTTGICVDKNVQTDRNKKRTCVYKIVDFENKRYMYIHIVEYDGGVIYSDVNYNVTDKVVIIHGAFSKRILYHYRISDQIYVDI